MGNETNKLESLIDSDSLPDIVTIGWWEPQIQTMLDRGMVYPLNELADMYDASFYDVTDDMVRDWYTMSDGNIYGYPNSTYTPKDLEEHDNIASNQTFLVRKDIYEAIGSPDMSTPEGFYNAVVNARMNLSRTGAYLLTSICRTSWRFLMRRTGPSMTGRLTLSI